MTSAGDPRDRIRQLDGALRAAVDRIDALLSSTLPGRDPLPSDEYAAEHHAVTACLDELHTATGRLVDT